MPVTQRNTQDWLIIAVLRAGANPAPAINEMEERKCCIFKTEDGDVYLHQAQIETIFDTEFGARLKTFDGSYFLLIGSAKENKRIYDGLIQPEYSEEKKTICCFGDSKMGEIAEATINGFFCEYCGQYRR